MPTNSATNAVAGRSYSSAGAAHCSIRPARITATRSAIDSASSWSCVTNSVVMPSSSWMRRISSRSCSAPCASSADSGSSSSSTRRLDRQRAGERDALLLAAGELVRVAAAAVPEADQLQQLGGARAPLARPRPCASAGRTRRSRRRSGAGTGCRTGRPCPCPAWPAGTGVMSLPSTTHLAGVGLLEAGDDAQRGGLAAAGRARAARPARPAASCEVETVERAHRRRRTRCRSVAVERRPRRSGRTAVDATGGRTRPSGSPRCR